MIYKKNYQVNNYVKKFAITRNGIKQPFKYEDDNLVELENVRKAVVEIYSKINSVISGRVPKRMAKPPHTPVP